MRKSIVISLRDITKKALITVSAIASVTALTYFEIPDKIFTKMAENIISEEYNSGFFKNMFSLSIDENIFLSVPHNKVLAAPEKPSDPIQIIKQEPPIPTPVPEKTPDNTDLSASISANSVSDRGVIVSNIAGKSFNITDLLNKPLNYRQDTGGYKVLILHSHTTESYFPDDRSSDETKNIVRVGKEFERVFNDNNIKALHITKIHDAPYSLSYKNSLASVASILSENPSIDIVIDVHRDAVFDKNNEKLKPVCTIDGEKAAQVMIVSGTNAGGLPHDNWIENLAFSLKIQKKMNEKYPGLARPINLSKERYNTHTTKASIIFEIGANGNTLEEAILGARYAAASIAELING